MYKEIMQAIPNISIYPIFSLILFVAVFSIVLIWVFKMDKSHVKHMSALPLDGREMHQRDGE